MSFNNARPNLVENKILKHYTNKFLKKEVTFNNNYYFYEKFKDILFIFLFFIKNNYGFFILIFSILLLLYIRYIEVNKKKEILKKYLI